MSEASEFLDQRVKIGSLVRHTASWQEMDMMGSHRSLEYKLNDGYVDYVVIDVEEFQENTIKIGDKHLLIGYAWIIWTTRWAYIRDLTKEEMLTCDYEAVRATCY